MNFEYSNSEMSRLIDEYIHSLRDREILKSRFIDGLTFGELSYKYSMSERQVKRIVAKADKIFLAILKSMK